LVAPGDLTFAAEMGDVEVPNPCTVKAPRGQATEGKRGFDRPTREVPYEGDPNVLKGTGTCKPEGELAVLKSTAPGYLEGKTWYI